MNNAERHVPANLVRAFAVQALLGALLGLVFGMALLVLDVAKMGTLFLNTDVKLVAAILYFSSLMTTFSLALVSSFALGIGHASEHDRRTETRAGGHCCGNGKSANMPLERYGHDLRSAARVVSRDL